MGAAPRGGLGDRPADAFRAHDYHWYDGDPFADRYEPWVPDSRALPRGVSALVVARGRAA